jgi:hypothetical protein
MNRLKKMLTRRRLYGELSESLNFVFRMASLVAKTPIQVRAARLQ